MAVEAILYRPLSETELEQQTCSEIGDTDHERAKDYLPYSVFLTIYVTAFVVIYVLFFHPEMKRTRADQTVFQSDNITETVVSTATTESEIPVSDNCKMDDLKNKMPHN